MKATKTILLLILAFMTISCSESRIKTNKMEFGDFNSLLDSSDKGRLDNSPADLALDFLNMGDKKEKHDIQVTDLTDAGTNDSVEVVIKTAVYEDDSVDKLYYRIHFRKRNNRWNISSAEHAWTCVAGRGHWGYSNEPCQ